MIGPCRADSVGLWIGDNFAAPAQHAPMVEVGRGEDHRRIPVARRLARGGELNERTEESRSNPHTLARTCFARQPAGAPPRPARVSGWPRSFFFYQVKALY